MEITKEWLVGFIEGEGNFHVSLSRHYKKIRPTYPFEFYPALQFRIFLREDDLHVLEKIKSFISIGRIYKKGYAYSRKRGLNSRDQVALYITSEAELLKLKEILQTCEFHSKKKGDMESFFKILDIKVQNKHLSPEGYSEILSLANAMNSKSRTTFQVKRVTE